MKHNHENLPNNQDIIKYIKESLSPEQLTSLMELILQGILLGNSYSEIANKLGYNHNYIKKLSAQLLNRLSEHFAIKITKKTLKEIISAKYQIVDQSYSKNIVKDWNTSPKLDNFYGRDKELKQLHNLIFVENKRLIYISGIGGVGKTSLSVKFMLNYQSEFPVIIWRSLRNAPLLNHLVTDIVSVISNYQNLEGSVDDLLSLLRQHRCLIILDNIETILAEKEVGYYRSDFENYGNFIRFLGASNHQSYIILTGREKPPEITFLEEEKSQVKSINLKGSKEASLDILKEKKILASEQEKLELAKLYNYHPLATKLVSNVIKDLFANKASNFLAQETTLLRSLNIILDEQFNRLSNTEKTIMNWLAINRELTSIEELAEDIIPPIQKSQLLSALQSLKWRSLLEIQDGKYSQQPVIMEYVLEKFINNIYQEIVNGNLDLFGKYPLTKITTKEYIRIAQTRLIIEPLITLLEKTFPVKIQLKKQLKNLLNLCKELPFNNYGVGNIIKISEMLKIALQEYNFRELPIWQTDLSNNFLRKIDFSYCDFKNVKFIHTLGAVLKIAYHPQGEIIAISDINEIIYLWRVKDGQNILKLSGHNAWAWDLKFSIDGQLLISASDDKTVKVWDIKTGFCLANYELKQHKANAISITKNNKIIAIGCNCGYLELWHWQDDIHHILQGHQGDINSLQFNHDDQFLFTASLDGTVKQWNLTDKTCFKTFNYSQNPIHCLSISPDDKLMLTVTINGNLQMWLIESVDCLYSLDNKDIFIHQAIFCPTGNSFATASESTITFWNNLTGKIIKSLIPQKGKIYSLAYSPNGKIITSASQQECLISFDIETGDRIDTLYGYSNHIWALSTDNNKFLVSGGTDGILRLWSWEKSSPLKEIKAHKGVIFAVAWHPQKLFFASSGSDRTVKIWHGKTGEYQQQILAHTDLVFTIAWHPEGEILAIAGSSNQIKFWNFNDNNFCLQLMIKTTEIMHLSWSNNGKILAIYTRKGEVFIYDYYTDKLELIFENKEANINDIRSYIAWKQNDNYLVFTGAKNQVVIWNRKVKKLEKNLQGHLAQVVGISFIKNDQFLITVSLDTTIRIWEFSSGKCVKVFTGHQAPIPCLTIINQDLFATGSADSTVRIWDVNTGECIKILRSDRPYEGMNIHHATGLTSGELDNLMSLGAINKNDTNNIK